MDATGKELTLWQDMLNRPNFWVEGCVPLRASLENRISQQKAYFNVAYEITEDNDDFFI